MSRDKERALPQDDLTEPGGKLRLFVELPLADAAPVLFTLPQTHYLLHVMRAKAGDHILVFNGKDGEWRARLEIARKTCIAVCEKRTEAQAEVPDLWLAFAPIKKTPGEYVAQKATELGVRVLQPVLTHRTIARRVNAERLRANAIEAAEQSGRLTVPEVRAAIGLDALLAAWPKDRMLVFCDEGGEAAPIAEVLASAKHAGGWGVLTGPEGGFDPGERAAIRALPYVRSVTLGPRIMRADTAALAALAVWQAIAGDWPRLVSPMPDH